MQIGTHFGTSVTFLWSQILKNACLDAFFGHAFLENLNDLIIQIFNHEICVDYDFVLAMHTCQRDHVRTRTRGIGTTWFSIRTTDMPLSSKPNIQMFRKTKKNKFFKLKKKQLQNKHRFEKNSSQLTKIVQKRTQD
mgnify:CR=1 FL=1